MQDSPLPENKQRTALLSLAALGVVYGDIGTSPLYALREVFAGAHHPVPLTHTHLLGILSLIFWSLLLVVSTKYIIFIMRADNRGEGGIMSLLALAQRSLGGHPRAIWLGVLGMLGAAFFYGDSVITPAISVLSAVEGLELVEPSLSDWVVPVTLAIVIILFAFQRYGSGLIGRWFGPVMLVWFVTLGGLGISEIVTRPEILRALSPWYAIHFFSVEPVMAFFSLGAVVLTVTGAEALYADMGHFGKLPIRLAWGSIVLPSLTLSYFGQGALLWHKPEAISNPFYLQAPSWGLYPLLILATLATVIASQAVISGAFSLTWQAIQLDFLPRMRISHTSSEERGQIYLPLVNALLAVAVVLLVLGFGSSSALAAAYGIAVVATMGITSILVYVVSRHRWKWRLPYAVLMLVGFLVVDLTFLAANSTKITYGGWLPIVIAVSLFVLMSSWRKGRRLLRHRRADQRQYLEDFARQLNSRDDLQRIPGTVVFLSPTRNQVPVALEQSLRHYACLQERLVVLQVVFHDEPYVPFSERVQSDRLAKGVYRVRILFGFMDTPDIPLSLRAGLQAGWVGSQMDTAFVIGRETLLAGHGVSMSQWRKNLFIFMARNAGSPTQYFRLPPQQVLELGMQIQL